MRNRFALSLVGIVGLAGVGFTSPVMAAQNLSSALTNRRICWSDGSWGQYGANGAFSFDAAGTNRGGSPSAGSGVWSVRGGNNVEITYPYMTPDHRHAFRVDSMSVGPAGVSATSGGLHPDGSGYSQVYHEGRFC